jgi:hypothetical protein
MTRFRFAAVAALAIPALLVTTTGGEAAKPASFRAQTSCKTKHTMTRDFAKGRGELAEVTRPGTRRGGAAALVPVKGAKMITKLIDLTLSNGNNVIDRKKKALTNKDGVAKTKHEFNNFGNYRMTFKFKVDGEVVAEDAIDFGVSDRVSGKCDPPVSGAG